MKYLQSLVFLWALSLFSSSALAQRPEVTISLNEPFFEALLDSVFQNSPPIEFPIASGNFRHRDAGTEDFLRRNSQTFENLADRPEVFKIAKFAPLYAASQHPDGGNDPCKEVIQLLRETNGVRTAVRFREGKILAPIAFTGNYNPPFVGCVPFSGYAETVIDLEFDQQNQRLIARARVYNVSLNGTGGVGGTLIAKMVQSSIDKKVNPIEVLTMDKVSFLLPVKKDVNLRMRATSVRHDVSNGALNITISYEFIKV